MRVRKTIICCNIGALCVNGAVVWLTLAKTFPVFLGVSFVAVFLGAAVWLSCYMQGVLLSQRRQEFHDAPTEKVGRITQ